MRPIRVLNWALAAFVVGGLVAPASAQKVTGFKVGQARTYAFLVGCGDYDKRELRPLQYTLRDVQELQKVLVETGVPKENIVLMHDEQSRNLVPESKKIREQLDLLLARVDRQSTLIVALSGHGIQFSANESNFFCPLDARLQQRETLIPLDEIYQQLQSCPAERKLLLVDACRNDPQSPLAKSRARVELNTVSRPQNQSVPQGIVALFSCSAGQESYEHTELKHGVFFYQMLEGWRGAADANKDRAVTLDEVLIYTKLKTEAFAHLELGSKQIPHLKGDFSGTWILKDLPLPLAVPPTSVVPQGPAGQWTIKDAAHVNGNRYKGTVDMRVRPSGLVDLTWYASDKRPIYTGLGFVEDGHLFAAYGTTDGYGVSLYRIRPDGSMEGRWATPGSQIGRELASGGTPGKVEGQYKSVGTDPSEGESYEASVSITRYGDTYYVGWRSEDTVYHGIGLRHGDWLAVAWSAPNSKTYGIMDYTLKGNSAQARWTLMGSSQLGYEILERTAAR